MFDCDGTLVDSLASIVQSMADAFTLHDLPPPPDQATRRVIGLPLTEAVFQLLPEAARDDVEEISDSYKTAFRALRQRGAVQDPLFPGTREVLENLNDGGWLMGVATGKSRAGLDSTLARHELARHFVTLQTSDVPPGKPHPDMLLRAVADAGVEIGRAVMIGDTTYDIEMARRAGAASIGVAWGYHEPEELRAAGAFTVIERFADLPEVLDEVMERAA